MTLKQTADQVHKTQVGYIGVKGRPNPWWGISGGNDCLGFQLFTMGVRTRTDYSNQHVSISAFRHAYGWHEVDLITDGLDALQFGDILGEEWPDEGKPFTGIPGHAERYVSHTATTITTTAANTGPRPGVPLPIGAWEKTRTITDKRNFVVAIRPPYLGEADTSPYGAKVPAGLTKKQVKVVAAFLNERSKDLKTTSVKDGVAGHNYWTLVQQWGRAAGKYGSTYKIDGIVGPRTRQIELLVYKAATKK